MTKGQLLALQNQNGWNKPPKVALHHAAPKTALQNQPPEPMCAQTSTCRPVEPAVQNHNQMTTNTCTRCVTVTFQSYFSPTCAVHIENFEGGVKLSCRALAGFDSQWLPAFSPSSCDVTVLSIRRWWYDTLIMLKVFAITVYEHMLTVLWYSKVLKGVACWNWNFGSRLI